MKTFIRRYLVLLTALITTPTTYACLNGLEMAAGRITLEDSVINATPGGPRSISFQQTYTTPPLVFILPGNDNSDPSTLRVKNITNTGFEVGFAVKVD